jgi:hypothetical protein
MRGWGMCLGGEGAEGQRVKECRIRVREFFTYSTVWVRAMQINKIRKIVLSNRQSKNVQNRHYLAVLYCNRILLCKKSASLYVISTRYLLY